MIVPGHPRIATDPAVCGGKPVVEGTRMRVSDVIGLLGAGVSEEELLDDYPWISADDVRACLCYAADAVGHPVVLAAE